MIIPLNTTVDTSSDTEMAALTNSVGTFSATSRPVIQNLGPGILWLGTSSTALDDYGLKLPVNAVYELPVALIEGAGKIYLKATTNSCDVRIINVG